MHLGIERLGMLLGKKAVGGISLGIQRPNTVQLLENHGRQNVVDREWVVGVDLLGGPELTQRLVVFKVVEVVETLAGSCKGFDYFYNLEYDKALREFGATQQVHPDDPFAVNHILSTVIFKELYRIGALDTEAYAADSFLTKKHPEPLDPKV